MSKIRTLLVVGALASVLAACSLPPLRPVTRSELMSTNIYSFYKIQDSPEQVLNALNERGEVVLKATEAYGRKRPVFVKLLATSGGLKVENYNR